MKIIIIDEQPLYRSGIINFVNSINPDCNINETCNARDALNLCKSIRHDYVFLELDLPDQNGVDLIKELKFINPGIKCIVITSYKALHCIIELMNIGINGYLHKSMSCIDTEYALKTIFNGKPYLTPEIESMWSLYHKNCVSDSKNQIHHLFSHREFEIIRLLCKGYTGKKISDMLCIAESTFNNHRNHIIKKMGVSNIVQIVNYAYKHGICKP